MGVCVFEEGIFLKDPHGLVRVEFTDDIAHRLKPFLKMKPECSRTKKKKNKIGKGKKCI